MRYPLYVYKDSGTVYGAQFFDMPEVFTYGESLGQLKHNAQEAAECRFQNTQDQVPAPTHDPSLLDASKMTAVAFGFLWNWISQNSSAPRT